MWGDVALITVPTTEDLCEFLAALSSGDIVLATSEGDYCPPDLCGLGDQIMAGDENTNPDYKIVVIDPDDNCLKWMDQPGDPVYDSTLIKPLMLQKTQGYGSDTIGDLRSDNCKLDLVSADFPVAMKLLVTWTALARNADLAVGDQYLKWKPRGVVGGVVADVLADYIQSNSVPTGTTEWVSGQYTAILDIPANPTGLYLAFTYITFEGGANAIQLSINAVAFKA